MKMNLKKWIATISIYEVILITYVIILKPFGRRMYSQDWEIFWTWFFIPPIAFTLIILIIIWSKGEKIKFDVLKDFKFSKKKYKIFTKKIF